MDYKYLDIAFTEEDIDEYRASVINKIFAVLGIFEDCQVTQDFSGYYKYLNRICTEFNGIYYMFGCVKFLQVVSVLKDMELSTDLSHNDVKQLVFHCISIVKKAKAR